MLSRIFRQLFRGSKDSVSGKLPCFVFSRTMARRSLAALSRTIDMKPLFAAFLSLSALTFDSSVAQASEREGIETRVVGHSRSDRADVEMDAFRYRPARPNQCSLSRNAVKGSFGFRRVPAGHGLAYRLTNQSSIVLAVKVHWEDENAKSLGLTRVDLQPGEERTVQMYFGAQSEGEGSDVFSQIEVQPALLRERSESFQLEAAMDILAPGEAFDQDSKDGVFCDEDNCTDLDPKMPGPGEHGPHFQAPQETRAAQLDGAAAQAQSGQAPALFRTLRRIVINHHAEKKASTHVDEQE